MTADTAARAAAGHSAKGLFVTATDTGAGKTHFALALMARLQAAGLRVNGMKPVAAGCEATAAGLRNSDAARIQARCSATVEYACVNPYPFAPAIAPHIAAAERGVDIGFDRIAESYARLAAAADVVVVEGAGGWLVPLGAGRHWPDLVRALKWPVLLVVGLRLGCINHALLSARAITDSGCRLAGWVANGIAPDYARGEATIACLRQEIAAPFLGRMPYNRAATAESAGAGLDLSALPVVGCGDAAGRDGETRAPR